MAPRTHDVVLRGDGFWRDAERAYQGDLPKFLPAADALAVRRRTFGLGCLSVQRRNDRDAAGRKYTVAGFGELIARTGWRVEQIWTDECQHYAIIGMRASR
jgi:hypothetical protein